MGERISDDLLQWLHGENVAQAIGIDASDWMALIGELIDHRAAQAASMELVRSVVREAIGDGPHRKSKWPRVEAIADRIAEQIVPVALSQRDQEVLSVLIDDVNAFGAGNDTDRKDEQFQRDTLTLLKRLKRLKAIGAAP